jgi:hypothetical protein
MIKSEIRSIVRNVLPKVDKTNKFHDVFLDACIEKVIAQLYNDIWTISPLNLQRYTKGYGYTTPIAVSLEATTGLYYSTLPESIIVFQDMASGVRRISTPTQGGLSFIPIDPRMHDLILSGSYVDTVTSKIGYITTPTRVEYYNMSAAIITSGVRMDLIIPFSKYEETDTVLIPEIADPRSGETFIDRVMKILGIVRQTDLKDDNSSADNGRTNQRDN